MSEKQIEQSIKNASASLLMEGFVVDEQVKAWCKKLLSGQITIEEYISLVKEKAGVMV